MNRAIATIGAHGFIVTPFGTCTGSIGTVGMLARVCALSSDRAKGSNMIWQPSSPEFRAMLRAYMECLLWTMPGADGDENPGDRFSVSRFTREARMVCAADCLQFLNMAQSAGMALWFWQDRSGPDFVLTGYGPGQYGHDLALSRNGHGAGFFDRRELEREGPYIPKNRTLGHALQEIACSMGMRDVYPAYGWIHCS